MKEVRVSVHSIEWNVETIYTAGGPDYRKPMYAQVDCFIQVDRVGRHEASFRTTVEVPFEKSSNRDEAADYIKSLFF